MANRDELQNDPEEVHRLSFEGGQSGLWTSMPGIVNDVNLAAMTCSVQPAIQGTVTDENGVTSLVNMPLLLDVPICFPQAGGFILTLPLQAGDEVLVSFSARCIDSWWQQGGVQPPIELRMHDLSDGFAIPGPSSQPKVTTGISTTSAQLRTKDGKAFLQIDPGGKITLTSPAEIDLNAPIKLNGDVAISGKLSSQGDATFGGAVTATGVVTGLDVKAGAISLKSHIHSGVTSGTGTTGAAQ